MTQSSQYFETQITQTVRLDYLLYLPPGYDDEPMQRWPLILFLHGGGAKGSDLERVRQDGMAQLLDSGNDLPFIVVSPQCPADSHCTLHVEALNVLLTEVITKHAVDENRIYMTGMSLGGAGSWMLAGAYPERFAAVAPVSSRIVPLPLERLTKLPIRVFHGDADELMPVGDAQRTADALEAMGANIELTIYPGVGHDAWKRVYNDPEFYEWLLKHKRSVGT